MRKTEKKAAFWGPRITNGTSSRRCPLTRAQPQSQSPPERITTRQEKRWITSSPPTRPWRPGWCPSAPAACGGTPPRWRRCRTSSRRPARAHPPSSLPLLRAASCLRRRRLRPRPPGSRGASSATPPARRRRRGPRRRGRSPWRPMGGRQHGGAHRTGWGW